MSKSDFTIDPDTNGYTNRYVKFMNDLIDLIKTSGDKYNSMPEIDRLAVKIIKLVKNTYPEKDKELLIGAIAVNEKLQVENEALKAELRASEVTYGVYIDGLHKEKQDLLQENLKLREMVAGLKAGLSPIHYPDLSAEKAAYETGKQRQKVNLISFRNGDKKEVCYFEVTYDKNRDRWPSYRQENGKYLSINTANVNYIEEI